MKTTQKLILALVAVAAFLFVGTGAANAQQKFGYINWVKTSKASSMR